MTFAQPEFLAAAPVAVFLLVLTLLARQRRLRRLANAYGDTAIRRLVPVDVQQFPRTRLACLVFAGLAICLAAAGPGVKIQTPGAAAALDIVIAVDVSLSMGATDIEPVRIERAREVVIRLAKELPQGRLSLVLFGDWPYTLVPPSEDSAVVAYFAESLTAALISDLASSIRTSSGDRGVSLPTVIAHARATLDARPVTGATQVIVAISDGAIPGDTEEVMRSVADAAEKGTLVWTAGIGTSAGAHGRPMPAGFDEQLLRSIARAGKGRYEDVGDDRGVRALVSGLRQLGGVSGPQDVVPERLTFWLTLLAIFVLLLEGGLDASKRLVPARAPEGTA